MTLRVVGQFRGSIDTLDLDTATVLDLKKAVSRDSGLAVSGLKLLAGGKHLKDDTSTLTECGIGPGKTIMVLRQDVSAQIQAEEGLSQRTERVAQAASMLSARAARDIGTGGRGNAWGQWEGGRGRGGRGRGDGGRGSRGRSRPDDRPEIELTNQDGEAMAIPAEDSAALMEGMMLHRKGLACISRMGMPASSASAPTMAPSASTPPLTTPDQVSPNDQTRPISATTITFQESGEVLGTEKEGSGSVFSAVDNCGDEKRSGWEEQKESMPQAEGSGDGKKTTTDGLEHSAPTEASQREPGGEALASRGATGMSVENSAPRKGVRHHALSASEQRLAQREALGLLMRADEAFRRCNPKYLECVDNYSYLCLDIVWLLFLMKDMSNLPLASRMLSAVENGFKKAHGPGLQRLTALKGEYCAEKLLYVRLHLLQGVVAFLQGDSGKASALLIRARAEAKTLKPNPALAARLIMQWRTVKLEMLKPKVALLALRAGRNDLDAAWQYLESLRQRQDAVRKERRRRKDRRHVERHGMTADKRGFVDTALVNQLVEGGFARPKAISALRKNNNEVGAALASLTLSSGNSSTDSPRNSSPEESLAVLQSLGVPPETARDVLTRAGTLCVALEELGLNASDQSSSPTQGKKRDKKSRTERGSMSEANDGRSSSEDGGQEEGGEGEGPSPEEMALYDELVADRGNQEEEGYLDITLEDEADAADMYLHLCRGNIPVAFDFDKIRAGIAAAKASTASADDATRSAPETISASDDDDK